MTKKRLGMATALIVLMVLSFGIIGCGSSKSATNTTKVTDNSLSAKQDASIVNLENKTDIENESSKTEKTEEPSSQEVKADTSANNAANQQVTANNQVDTTVAKEATPVETAPAPQPVVETPVEVAAPVAPVAALTAEGQRVLELTNEQRANAGLNTLVYDGTLTAIANVRAQEIVEKWAHVRPDGTNITALAKDYGYSYAVLGENLAKGQTSPEQAVAEWMASEGHRANILGNRYNKIGIGVFSANGKMYWVQIFSN